jgi:hypothetical protein
MSTGLRLLTTQGLKTSAVNYCSSRREARGENSPKACKIVGKTTIGAIRRIARYVRECFAAGSLASYYGFRKQYQGRPRGIEIHEFRAMLAQVAEQLVLWAGRRRFFGRDTRPEAIELAGQDCC